MNNTDIHKTMVVGYRPASSISQKVNANLKLGIMDQQADGRNYYQVVLLPKKTDFYTSGDYQKLMKEIDPLLSGPAMGIGYGAGIRSILSNPNFMLNGCGRCRAELLTETIAKITRATGWELNDRNIENLSGLPISQLLTDIKEETHSISIKTGEITALATMDALSSRSKQGDYIEFVSATLIPPSPKEAFLASINKGIAEMHKNHNFEHGAINKTPAASLDERIKAFDVKDDKLIIGILVSNSQVGSALHYSRGAFSRISSVEKDTLGKPKNRTENGKDYVTFELPLLDTVQAISRELNVHFYQPNSSTSPFGKNMEAWLDGETQIKIKPYDDSFKFSKDEYPHPDKVYLTINPRRLTEEAYINRLKRFGVQTEARGKIKNDMVDNNGTAYVAIPITDFEKAVIKPASQPMQPSALSTMMGSELSTALQAEQAKEQGL